MPAGPPERDVEVPAAVSASAAGRPVRAVWENELGGFTFEVGTRSERCFVKWVPSGGELDLAAEAARMRWLARWSRVPVVLDVGRDSAGSWLVTSPLCGRSAVTEEPAVAVAAVGAGLRFLHDNAPAEECPFSWSAHSRLQAARERVAAGVTDPPVWHHEHRRLTTSAALGILATPPPVDRAVVCHGDACLPNTIVDTARWSGHVDFGSLGVADRWADLAVATWSATWNFGPGWEPALLEAYGIEPDAQRTAYYRLLWDLT